MMSGMQTQMCSCLIQYDTASSIFQTLYPKFVKLHLQDADVLETFFHKQSYSRKRYGHLDYNANQFYFAASPDSKGEVSLVNLERVTSITPFKSALHVSECFFRFSNEKSRSKARLQLFAKLLAVSSFITALDFLVSGA